MAKTASNRMLNYPQVEQELDEEEQDGLSGLQGAPDGLEGGAVDNLQFLRDVEEHQAMLEENMRRAELLAQRMHADAALRRREARERAKNSLLEAAAAEVAVANSQIDVLKHEVALRLASRARPASALEGAEGGWGAAAEDD